MIIIIMIIINLKQSWLSVFREKRWAKNGSFEATNKQAILHEISYTKTNSNSSDNKIDEADNAMSPSA